MSKRILNRVGHSTMSYLAAGFFLMGGAAVPTSAPFPVVPAAATAGAPVIGECFWNEFDWDDRRPSEQNAWAVLGWNRQRWDAASISAAPASESKYWDELTRGERGAVTDLGFTQETWDDGPDC